MFQIDVDTSALELLENPSHEDQAVEPDVDYISITLSNKISLFLDSVEGGEHDIDSLYDTFIRHASYSEAEVKLAETVTRGQSNNPAWIDMRKGLITASNFKRVYSRTCTLLDDPSTDISRLLAHLMGPSGGISDNVPALKWGRDREKEAVELYTTLEGSKHKELVVKDSGLHLCRENPMFGCSPDGLATCKCTTHAEHDWLLEVKCPYTLRELHPNEAAKHHGCSFVNNSWVLDQNHPYYA